MRFGLAGVALAFFEATQLRIRCAVTEHCDTFSWSFALLLPPWLLLALLAPIPLVLAQRLPLQGDRRRLSIGVHTGAAVLFSALHLFLLALFHRIVFADPTPLVRHTVYLLGYYLVPDVMVYWAIAGSTIAVVYYRSLRQGELDASRLRAQLAEARLHGLTEQLRPHFLFNALNTVAMLARRGETQSVVSMTSDLSGLLRYVLRDRPVHEVTLGDEIDFTKQYLAIERARFQSRLIVDWQVDDAVRAVTVPMLLLQPIVENVIHHAVARVIRPVILRVTARAEQNRLAIDIVDDGPGLPAGWEFEQHARIGLRNTRDRLVELYPAEPAFAIIGRDGGGVDVRIRIPMQASATVAPLSDDRLSAAD